jgi:hypothetical protein
MWIRSLIVSAVVVLSVTMAHYASAQTRSSGMSAFGSGSGGFGSSGFGSSFGSGGFGSGFGSSGFGSSFSSSGFGSGFGSTGFGSNQTGNKGFVGRDANDMQAIFTQLGRSSNQFFNNMNRQMARGQQTSITTRNPPQPIRTEVQVAFAAPQPSADVVAKSLQIRLAKIMGEHHMTVPTVSVQNGTAVVSGVAKSENERSVIESLVSLEPGVRSVRNEMTVAGAPISNTSAPPGS